MGIHSITILVHLSFLGCLEGGEIRVKCSGFLFCFAYQLTVQWLIRLNCPSWGWGFPRNLFPPPAPERREQVGKPLSNCRNPWLYHKVCWLRDWILTSSHCWRSEAVLPALKGNLKRKKIYHFLALMSNQQNNHEKTRKRFLKWGQLYSLVWKTDFFFRSDYLTSTFCC